MTNEPTADPGWYVDPLGRHEHRYFNGRSWTSDVSDGGDRRIDPYGVTPTSVALGPPPSGGHGAATASMVLGIIAISIAWMPVLVVIGVIVGVLAIVFGIVGIRRARPSGEGRSFAVAGIATGASALVAAVVGVVLTVVVLDAYNAYLDPPPHEVTVTRCELEGSRAVMAGRIGNIGDRAGDYSVVVGFTRTGTDNPHRTVRVSVDGVEAGEEVPFEAQSQVDLDDVDCVILDVTGPLPFGIDID